MRSQFRHSAVYNGMEETEAQKHRRWHREGQIAAGERPARHHRESTNGFSADVNFGVVRKPGEDFERMMRRFKKASHGFDGRETYKAAHRTHYEKPSEERHKQEQDAQFWQGVQASHDLD